MTTSRQNLNVRGTLRNDDRGLLLVLDQRLDGHDTFLSGRLDLGQGLVPVRILTLDDVTVLQPLEPLSVEGSAWSGTLHLPRGLRPRSVPLDLAHMAEALGRDLDTLDAAELRYALTFLGEATTQHIRDARIQAIVSALPTIPGKAD